MPRRPLDEDFIYTPRCSTPTHGQNDTTSDRTIFATPNSSLIVEDANVTDDQATGDNTTTSSGSHKCPENLLKTGKQVLLSKISKPELVKISLDLGLKSDCPQDSLRRNIDTFYRREHPTWPRNSMGILIFTKNFDIETSRPLAKFSKDELYQIFEHFNIDAPGPLKSKKTVLSLLENQLLRRFQTAEKDASGSSILTPELLKAE